jgi:hypothetical protein
MSRDPASTAGPAVTAGVPGGWLGPVEDALPVALAHDFAHERVLSSEGAEGVLHLVTDVYGQQRVIKVYRPGMAFDDDVLTLLKGSADPDHVVALLDHGVVEGRHYEVLPYLPAGTLESLLNEVPRRSDTTLAAIVSELAEAIRHLHGLGVQHRDIKPSNVLVLGRTPLNLVLADLGLATLRDGVLDVSRQRTIIYGSAESQWGDLRTENDWWSLGVIAAEVALGHHPLRGMSERDAAEQIVKRGIPLDGIEDERALLLCRGLLTREPTRRWSYDQVKDWLDGGSPEVRDDARAPSTSVHVLGRECSTESEVAAALALRWRDAVGMLRGGLAADHLYQWLADRGGLDEARLLDEIRAIDHDERQLAALLCHLDPQLAPTYRDLVLTRASLEAAATAAAQAPDGDESERLEALYGSGCLDEYAARGKSELEGLQGAWAEARSAWMDLMSDRAPTTSRARAAAGGAMLRGVLAGGRLPLLVKDQRRALPGAAFAQGWFRSVFADALKSPGAFAALAPLSVIAAQETRDDAVDASSEVRQRIPRTRRCLAWTLVGLSIGVVAAFVANALGTGVPEYDDVVNRATQWRGYRWIDADAFLGNLRVGGTIVIITGIVLLVLTRRMRPGSDVPGSVRMRWGMQVLIVVAALLLPLLLPFVIAGFLVGVAKQGPIRNHSVIVRLGMSVAPVLAALAFPLAFFSQERLLPLLVEGWNLQGEAEAGLSSAAQGWFGFLTNLLPDPSTTIVPPLIRFLAAAAFLALVSSTVVACLSYRREWRWDRWVIAVCLLLGAFGTAIVLAAAGMLWEALGAVLFGAFVVLFYGGMGYLFVSWLRGSRRARFIVAAAIAGLYALGAFGWLQDFSLIAFLPVVALAAWGLMPERSGA